MPEEPRCGKSFFAAHFNQQHNNYANEQTRSQEGGD